MRSKRSRGESMREDIVRIGNNLAEHLHENNIKNIIFLDRSARPGYIALKKAWKNKFPGTSPPNVYFTNPEGHNTYNRFVSEVAEEFNNTYTELAANKEADIMIFDVCMHSGDTVRPVLKTLKEAGYSNVTVGLAQPKNRDYCHQQVDFLALDYQPENGCYPFGRDNIIMKDRISVVSPRSDNEGDRKYSSELRKEISSLF